MCEALAPGERTTVRAGDAAISLDLPSVGLGFVLALFAWGWARWRAQHSAANRGDCQRGAGERFDPEWREEGWFVSDFCETDILAWSEEQARRLL